MLLWDYSRSLGLAMGSIGQPSTGLPHVGWTTDRALAEKLREAGAHVVSGYGADDTNQGIPAGKYPKSKDTPMGWEVSFRQGAEAVLDAEAA